MDFQPCKNTIRFTILQLQEFAQVKSGQKKHKQSPIYFHQIDTPGDYVSFFSRHDLIHQMDKPMEMVKQIKRRGKSLWKCIKNNNNDQINKNNRWRTISH